MKKKTIIIGTISLMIVFGFLFSVNTYQSSPDFTTQEFAQEFYENKPSCYGISILLNKKATWADAPGRSLCIGLLLNK